MYINFFSATEISHQGVWVALEELEDPELIRLANMLPNMVLQSQAQSSTKKYLGGFRRWRAWAQQHDLSTFPAEGHHVALYLQHIRDRVQSKGAVEEAVHALFWAHSLAGLESPGLNPLVEAILEGLKRMLAKPVVKKAPVMGKILKAIVDDAARNPTLSNICLASACLLAYAGFLRADELIKLRSCNISMDGGNMVV